MREHNFCEVIDDTILNTANILSIIRINGHIVIKCVNEEKFVFNEAELTEQFKDFLAEH